MWFTEGHAWLKEQDQGHLLIGISDYAETSLGDVVFVSLPPVGAHFEAGHEIVVIESVKAADGILMPVSGKVLVVNEGLLVTPEKVNDLDEEDRWFVLIAPDQPSLPEGLMDEAKYRQFIA